LLDRILRRAESADAAMIADLVRLAFSRQSRPTNPPSSAMNETAVTIADHLARGGGAVIEIGRVMVGAVLWEEAHGGLYLSRLAVRPEHRRQGIARALIDDAEREARRRGLPSMCLSVRLVLDDNRRLFASCGFEDTVLQSHAGFSEPTSVVMERRIN
jgi:ribosomal protein S18 acetylase RimI-like enzyme